MTYHLSSKNKRQYLSLTFNPLKQKDLKEVIDRLLNTPPLDFKMAAEWFGLFHELSCAVSEAQTILELNINLDNKNIKLEKKLEEFEQNILSELLSCREKMIDIYLSSPFKYSMHGFDNGRIEKDILARKKFSIAELSPLQIEENKIVREYKKLINSAMTDFDGKTILLSSIVGKLHDQNVVTRKAAFFTYWNYIQQNEKKFQEIFDALLENRRQQSYLVGCASYTEIAFSELGRIDYTASDCARLRRSILNKVTPIITQLSQKQVFSFNEKSLMPWNSQVWPALTPKLPPANGSMLQLFLSLQKIMTKIHPSFGNLFLEMQKKNLIDVYPKQGKSPGAFSVTFQESELPFIFGNFGANLRDMFTFIHEFGHCLHGFAVTNIKNILLRHPGFEFCELASIGLELLSTKFFNELWNDPQDAQNALKYQLFQMLQFWPFMAMIDEWQHEVYSAEKFLNFNERNTLWQKISRKYKPHIDWSECPEFEKFGWLSRPHVYTSPFYFIDYGIAQIGALQLWLLSKQDYSSAIDKYIKGLSLGAQLDLPSLFKEAGVKFDFGEDLIDELCQEILKNIID